MSSSYENTVTTTTGKTQETQSSPDKPSTVKIITGKKGKTRFPTPEEREKITSFIWQRKLDGRTEATLEQNSRVLNILAGRANLLEPESVKEFLATATVKNSTKVSWIIVYKAFCKQYSIQFKEPKYVVEDSLPFIPREEECKTIIDAASRHSEHRALLMLLYETGMRSGEAQKLKLADFDFVKRTVLVHPEKGSRSREIRLTEQLCSLLKFVYSQSEKPFPTSLNARLYLGRIRKSLAKVTGNPRFSKIHLHTFRHYRASTLYNATRDILKVQQMLGHKGLNNTMKYTQLLDNPESEEWIVQEAKTVEEAKELGKRNFQYFTTIDSIQLFRRRK